MKRVMMSRFFRPAILLLVVTFASMGQPVMKNATFHTRSDLVLVPVTVTDHFGKTVQGLKAENFTVFDDQRNQQVVSFSNEDVPCSVGVILDVSGSMRNSLDAAKSVAHAFFGAANPEDEFFLMTVSSNPSVLSGFVTDLDDLEKSIDAARADGMTALIDTVYLGLNRMRHASKARRALLVLSDGIDNNSRYSKGELMRMALEADVQVYTVTLNTNPGGTPNGVPFRPSLIQKPIDQARERQGPLLLEELSEKTGGLHFRVSSQSQATEAALKSGRALRDEYLIGYRPPESAAAGKWHHVRVKADVPKVSVSARIGYYAQ